MSNYRKSRNRRIAEFLSRASLVEDIDASLTPSRIDSATISTITTTIVDSNYVATRNVTIASIDSASVRSLIDSNYIAARITQPQASIDSATIASITTSLIDSDYISNRVTISGGGGGSGGTSKLTYAYDGELATYTGVKRTYITENATISKADMFVKTAPIGASITAVLNKNGSSIATISLASGDTSSINNTINQSVLKGDYLTMDVTSVGLTPPGEDMVINLIFG